MSRDEAISQFSYLALSSCHDIKSHDDASDYEEMQ